MQNIQSKKTMIVLFIILLALVAVVATVSAADTMTAAEASGLDSAVAMFDTQGTGRAPVNGLKGVDGPISGTDHRLISPWVIDPDDYLF